MHPFCFFKACVLSCLVAFSLTSYAIEQTMPMHLERLSHAFLGKPYQWYVLGEGSNARYDQSPLYRFDAFDCETFVTTVLALALSGEHGEYKTCLRALRYQEGKVGFLTRRHFTSVDWNVPHQHKGILKDITKTIVDARERPIYKVSKTQIDKGGWYQYLPASRIRLKTQNQALQASRLKELRALGHHLPAQEALVPYLPLSTLLADVTLFNQFPNGAILEIIRPNWPVKDKVGTNLDISHLGFVFRKSGKLWFRNASSIAMKVVDQPLIEYLREAAKSPTIQGVNLQVFLPKKPTPSLCDVKMPSDQVPDL